MIYYICTVFFSLQNHRHVMNFELASNLKDRQIHKQEKMGAVNTIAVQKNSTHEYANIHRKTHTQRN